MKRHGNCISITKEDLVHLLYGDNYKIKEIRKLVGCSAQAIKNVISRRNIEKRSLKTLRDRFYQYVDKTLDRCMRKKYSSAYKGVVWDKSGSKWMAVSNGKYVGRFETEAEAIVALQKLRGGD